MMSQMWQHPYVNVFKLCNIEKWKKCSKEGDVTMFMFQDVEYLLSYSSDITAKPVNNGQPQEDKTLKSYVHRIMGSVPAGNYIQLPKASSQSLSLTGHYYYLLFKPVPRKYFVVHLDVSTHEGLVIRISFSNLFKEFKASSTWLQFPYVANPSPKSVEGVTGTTIPIEDKLGSSPLVTRWTLLCLDLKYILSVYLNCHYSHLKGMRICASMLVKGCFTSDSCFEPGVAVKDARKMGLTDLGLMPLPREMTFFLNKDDNWHDKYDFVKFPTSGTSSYRDVFPGKAKSPSKLPGKDCTSTSADGFMKKKYTKKAKLPRVTLIEKVLSENSPRRQNVARSLPEVNILDNYSNTDSHIHIFCHPNDKEEINTKVSKKTSKSKSKSARDSNPSRKIQKAEEVKTLLPDPILVLDQVLGFSGLQLNSSTIELWTDIVGSDFKLARQCYKLQEDENLLWTSDSCYVLYPCNAVIIVVEMETNKQSFLIGHSNKVSSIAFNKSSTLLASIQEGESSMVRIWKWSTRKCISHFQTHMNNGHNISFSNDGERLCAVGENEQQKQMIVIWNTSKIIDGGKASLMAKAHADISIRSLKMIPYDGARMVSCGDHNIRLWRVKEGSFRSCAVDMKTNHNDIFTDLDFLTKPGLVKDSSNVHLYVCSKSGKIYQIDYKTAVCQKVFDLSSNVNTTDQSKQFINNRGINCLVFSDGYCATGGDDGFLRIWQLDFKNFALEAEHDGPVTTLSASPNGNKVIAATKACTCGILDVSSKIYQTVVRSHTSNILSLSINFIYQQFATISNDKSVKIWNLDTLKQEYDFQSPQKTPTCIEFHPERHVFLCGFNDGSMRLFSLSTMKLQAEVNSHKGAIVQIILSHDGIFLYAYDSYGTLSLSEVTTTGINTIRVLPKAINTTVESKCLSINNDGTKIAYISSSPSLVTISNAKTLDEILIIDITSMNLKHQVKDETALLTLFTPKHIGHLLVSTSASRLLKLNLENGQLLTEISNIQRGMITNMCISNCGRYLATTADCVIKIWDYNMKLDINFQIFIGHCEQIMGMLFTADNEQLITYGEAIFFWDFLANDQRNNPKRLSNAAVNSKQVEENKHPNPSIQSSSPPRSCPRPLRDTECFKDDRPQDGCPMFVASGSSSSSSDTDNRRSRSSTINTETGLLPSVEAHLDNNSENASERIQIHPVINANDVIEVIEAPEPTNVAKELLRSFHSEPTSISHFKPRMHKSKLAATRYTAPAGLAGLKMEAVVGYDGHGRNNMIWHSDSGLFAYSCGCLVVIESLTNSQQKHLHHHTEDISTLAIQNDGQVLASAALTNALDQAEICIWEIRTGLCRKVVNEHQSCIVAMDFSRDDRFLITISDYKESSIVIWSCREYNVLTKSYTRNSINSIKWDPFTVNEFVTVGQNGSVLFWLLDETNKSYSLSVHETDVPLDLSSDKESASTVHFTSCCYGNGSMAFAATSTGSLSIWDTRQNKCFMHWEADTYEITVLLSKAKRLITGGASKNLKLWSLVGIDVYRQNEESDNQQYDDVNRVVMEDELNLDDIIVSAAFDECLETGVVGTCAGSIWFINWEDRSSVRLVSGHSAQINELSFCNQSNSFFATCCDDGGLRLWTGQSYEQTLQFLVLNQKCICSAFSPLQPSQRAVASTTHEGLHSMSTMSTKDNSYPRHCVAGYDDGTMRIFDLELTEMVLKLHPHRSHVNVVSYSPDGRVIISGSDNGLVAISSPATGMTIRLLKDHKRAPISSIDTSLLKDHPYSSTAPILWLVTSQDRRASVWAADWSKDFCELVDWLTFPAPGFAPNGTAIVKGSADSWKALPKTIARFHTSDPDIIVYTGYGIQKAISIYSLAKKEVIRQITVSDWLSSLVISPSGDFIAAGTSDRLVKLIDYNEETFQDFVAHSDSIHWLQFSPSGERLFSVGFHDIIVWKVLV